jgi:hypothetical protein
VRDLIKRHLSPERLPEVDGDVFPVRIDQYLAFPPLRNPEENSQEEVTESDRHRPTNEKGKPPGPMIDANSSEECFPHVVGVKPHDRKDEVHEKKQGGSDTNHMLFR